MPTLSINLILRNRVIRNKKIPRHAKNISRSGAHAACAVLAVDVRRVPQYTCKTFDNSTRGCGWESLMKNVTLGNVTMSHRTRERPAECLASLSHSTMIGLPRAQH
ncbi:hypothetical protein EVAR_13606_1 [Eumeta japonica]|uniref:Uncharacterized protein n=1 Tax=Eumeta variegata TaxID=151549 RepID=A0A4C1UT85_EUMVA|nr:hypothetical protein EVAR_13606_1 [Eumeta japonica]